MFRARGGGEEALIRRIRALFPVPPPEAEIPIGDDAAVLRRPRRRIILTTDQLVEGVHFRRPTHPPEMLGARALVVNLSDAAGMGAVPRWFLLSLLLPADLPPRYLFLTLKGMAREARRQGVFLIGGNLSAAATFGLDICLAGEIPAGARPLRREGARPGDRLYVSGTLGGSALGLELLGQGWRWRGGRARLSGAPTTRVRAATRALRRHLAPSAEGRLGRLLATHRLASAGMDISDGLSRDLDRLCRASGVGARVVAGELPVDPAALALRGEAEARKLALHGGEDYRLLFTVPRSRESRLSAFPAARRIRRIGTIVDSREGIRLEEGSGRSRLLTARGFDHLLVRREGPRRSGLRRYR